MDDELFHYGTPRHSGRYPWGSGDNPYQRNANFLGYVQKLKADGVSEVNIAKGMGMTTKELRAKYSIAKDEKRMADAAMAIRLRNKGMSYVAIGKRMGINESSVRALCDPALKVRSEATMATANMLKENVDKKRFIDIGKGTEQYLGVSSTKLDTSVEMLKAKGYVVHNIKVKQLGTGQFTTVKVLCPPGTTLRDVSTNRDKISSIAEWTDNGGESWISIKKPRSVSSDRIEVNYTDSKGKGGAERDGLIEIRRGVDDISLGDNRYAQVRIAVDGTHYLKGMAVYSDNLPKGVDIRFNTNKHDTGNKLDALKKLSDDPDNPFGATIRQREYTDSKGNKQLSAINVVNEEGDWAGWKKNLSSQVLSKQLPALAKKQLALGYDYKQQQYEEISSLTNPAVKKKLLQSFADECDSSAVHLEAAAMPRQASHVILPFSSIKDTEVYAPNYKDGERVVLIRYPHGGKFEIPELTVNNKNKEAKNAIGSAPDAIGINHKVAERLSGADFDGDTVLVIPNKKGPYSIKTSSPLEGLKNFDPKEAYPGYKGMKVMDSRTKGIEMGKVSNLITDMTIRGADDDEIAAAVRHSMVVIDAEKHELNYKQSYNDNRIAELSKKYQGKAGGGASTLISKASSEIRVPTRREYVDKTTGERVFKPKNETYIDKRTGKEKVRTTKSTKMFEAKDAKELSSGTVMETVYANHANSLKSLANQARKQAANIKPAPVSSSAKKTYSKEVESLNSKLRLAEMNAPLERQAQLLANTIVASKRRDNPNMDSDDIKKVETQALNEARLRIGASKKDVMVKISDREWEAIQAGAISTSKLTRILNNTDETRVKELATPKSQPAMTPAKLSRAKSMLNSGCTRAEVAERLGISVSTLSKALS